MPRTRPPWWKFWRRRTVPGPVPAVAAPETTLTLTCPESPTQIEGRHGDLYVYFRYRWGFWSLDLGDTADEAVRGQYPVGDGEEVPGGDGNGYIPEDQAYAFILALLTEWDEEQASWRD